MTAWLLFSAFLIVYGNAVSTIMANPTPLGDGINVIVGALLIVLSAAWARQTRMGLSEIGLDRSGALRSAAIGLLAALVTVVPALLFLRFPPLLGAPVEYAPAESIAVSDLLRRLFFTMPIDTVLPEEIAFRGVLLAGVQRFYPTVTAALITAVPFTVWHLVIVTRTLEFTNLANQPLFTLLGFAGALAAVFVGGLIFAWLRIRTRNLAASMTAHWAFNASLLVGLRLFEG